MQKWNEFRSKGIVQVEYKHGYLNVVDKGYVRSSPNLSRLLNYLLTDSLDIDCFTYCIIFITFIDNSLSTDSLDIDCFTYCIIFITFMDNSLSTDSLDIDCFIYCIIFIVFIDNSLSTDSLDIDCFTYYVIFITFIDNYLVTDYFITFQLSRCARIGSPDSRFEKGRNTNFIKNK